MSALKNFTQEQYIEDHSYRRFSKFKTVDEFNSHFEQSMLFHKKRFTKSEYIALNRLRKYAYSENSPDTIGVAWSKIQTVVAATHEKTIFGISRSTFERMLKKAIRLNLVKVRPQFKDNKRQKHNVYTFNRFEELTPEAFEIVEIVPKTNTIDVGNDMKIDTPITLLLELPKLKELNTYSQAKNVIKDMEIDKKIEKEFQKEDTPYHKVRKMIEGLLPEKDAVYKIYGIWLAHTKHLGFEIDFEVCRFAVKKLIQEVKRRKSLELISLENPYGYFNGIVKNMIAVQAQKNIEEIESSYEWFTALRDRKKIAYIENDRVVRKMPDNFKEAYSDNINRSLDDFIFD